MDSKKRPIGDEAHESWPIKKTCYNHDSWPIPPGSESLTTTGKDCTSRLQGLDILRHQGLAPDVHFQKTVKIEDENEGQHCDATVDCKLPKNPSQSPKYEEDVEEVTRKPCCHFRDTVSKLMEQWGASSNAQTWPGSDEHYRYMPISTDQIRLVIIAPGTNEDGMLVSLVTIDNINRSAAVPQYEALSYVWGDATATDKISIQLEPRSAFRVHKRSKSIFQPCNQFRKKLPVRTNLTQALKALRKPTEPRVLWIDALCIDQSNIQERNTQVAKMGEIYRSAQNVCVWLGTDTIPREMPSAAMDCIPELARFGRFDTSWKDEEQMFKYVAVLQLMKNTWFTRRWVVQEIAYAQNATIYHGDSSVDWKQFQDSVAVMNCCYTKLKPTLMAHMEELYPAKGHWLLDPDFDIKQLGANRLLDVTSDVLAEKKDGALERTKSLESLICFMQGYETSDPRDVYNSIRNLAADPDLPAPDYSLSVFETYRQVVQHCVKTSRSLDIICRRWAQDPSSSSVPISLTEPAIPTWILRGRDAAVSNRKTFVGLPGETQYAACGKARHRRFPVVDFPGPTIRDGIEVPNTSLLLRGVTIGRITTCTEPMTDNVIPSIVLEKLGWETKKFKHKKNKIPEKLSRTLVADRGPNGTPTKAWYLRAAQYLLSNHLQNGHLNIDRTLLKTDGCAKVYLERVKDVIHDRTFFEALSICDKESANFFGLGPADAKEGDVIVVLYGLSVPAVLRPVHGFWGQREYMFVGEAYVDGMMEGEAFESEYEESSFKLI